MPSSVTQWDEFAGSIKEYKNYTLDTCEFIFSNKGQENKITNSVFSLTQI